METRAVTYNYFDVTDTTHPGKHLDTVEFDTDDKAMEHAWLVLREAANPGENLTVLVNTRELIEVGTVSLLRGIPASEHTQCPCCGDNIGMRSPMLCELCKRCESAECEGEEGYSCRRSEENEG
jgi:hypothetical protein